MLKENTKLRGFFRLQLENEDGTKEKATPWMGNQITNLGYLNYLALNLGSQAGSKQVGFMAIGTGGAPAVADTTLAGEVMGSTKRTAVAAASSSNSKAIVFTATFPAGFITGAGSNISNVGLYAATTTNDTLFAGAAYTSSACASNQAVNATYQINFS